MTLWPLPGGTGSYLRSLRKFLSIVSTTSDTYLVADKIVDAFPNVTSTKAARSYLHVVETLGLVEMRPATLVLTRTGERYLETQDPKIIKKALFDRVAAVREIVESLSQNPTRLGLLLEDLAGHDVVAWSTLSQVRYRVQWLMEVGVLGSRGKGRPEYYVLDKRAV